MRGISGSAEGDYNISLLSISVASCHNFSFPSPSLFFPFVTLPWYTYHHPDRALERLNRGGESASVPNQRQNRIFPGTAALRDMPGGGEDSGTSAVQAPVLVLHVLVPGRGDAMPAVSGADNTQNRSFLLGPPYVSSSLQDTSRALCRGVVVGCTGLSGCFIIVSKYFLVSLIWRSLVDEYVTTDYDSTPLGVWKWKILSERFEHK